MINPDVSTVQYIVDSIKRQPNFQVPTAIMGILINSTSVPVSRSVSRFKMMAIPVTPPGASALGSKNRLTATEYKRDARVICI